METQTTKEVLNIITNFNNSNSKTTKERADNSKKLVVNKINDNPYIPEHLTAGVDVYRLQIGSKPVKVYINP